MTFDPSRIFETLDRHAVDYLTSGFLAVSGLLPKCFLLRLVLGPVGHGHAGQRGRRGERLRSIGAQAAWHHCEA